MSIQLRIIDEVQAPRVILPKPGYLYSYHVGTNEYYCLVARCPISMAAGEILTALTYFYTTGGDQKCILDKLHLLLPPVLLWCDSWRYGVFEYKTQLTLTSKLIYNEHLFHDIDKGLVNEYRQPVISGEIDCGIYGMAMLSSVEVDIALSLGIVANEKEYLTLPKRRARIYHEASEAQHGTLCELRVSNDELQALQIEINKLEDLIIDFVNPEVGQIVGSGSDGSWRNITFEIRAGKMEHFTSLINFLAMEMHLTTLQIADTIHL